MEKMSCILLLLIITVFPACKNGNGYNKTTSAEKIVGTWRLVAYEDYDSTTGKWNQLYGKHPKGYFTYTKNGIVNINGAAENPLLISEEAAYQKPLTIGALLDNAWGLEAASRLSCQARMAETDLVIEIPKYTINHEREEISRK